MSMNYVYFILIGLPLILSYPLIDRQLKHKHSKFYLILIISTLLYVISYILGYFELDFLYAFFILAYPLFFYAYYRFFCRYDHFFCNFIFSVYLSSFWNNRYFFISNFIVYNWRLHSNLLFYIFCYSYFSFIDCYYYENYCHSRSESSLF